MVTVRNEFERAAIGTVISACILGRVLYLCWRIERWHGWQRLARALRPHELQRILRHWIRAVSLHGIDGSEGADAFVCVHLQGRGKGNHAAGMAQDFVSIEGVDAHAVSVTRRRAELRSFYVRLGEHREAVLGDEAALRGLATRRHHLQVAAHVAGSRGNAAVTVGDDDGWRLA